MSYDFELDQLTTDIHLGANNSNQTFYDYSYRSPFGYFDEMKNENGMPTAQAHYYYDQTGQIEQKNVYSANIQSNLKMQYSDIGNLKSLATANTSDTVNASYEYYPDGKLKKITYPKLNDNTLLTTEYTYNPIGRLTSVINRKASTVLSRFDYTYDANGNIITAGDGSATKTYTYDKLNRLIEIQPSSACKIVYTYDLRGNRSTQSGGNLNPLNTSYSYDIEDRLELATKETATTYMDYYADGLRAGKYTPSSSDLYVYDLSGHVVAEAHNSYSITANYVWGPDRVLSKKETGGGEYSYLYNGHGDVVQIVDKNGKIVNNYKYDEWGNILESNETISNPFKYAGEIYDQETGLYYLRARYYDPALGRFINEDTYEGQVTNPLSLNLYYYCYNNPLSYIDPTGHTAYTVRHNKGEDYQLYMEDVILDSFNNVAEYFPLYGGIRSLVYRVYGIKEISMTKAATKLGSILENIKQNDLTTTSLDVIGNFMYIAKELNIPLSKGLKNLGKTAGLLGTAFSVIDSVNLGIDIKNKHYAIEHIVYNHLEKAIRSNTREGVEIKYTYAYFAVKRLIEQGKITYNYDGLTYWVNSWNTERNQLVKEINELDYYLVK